VGRWRSCSSGGWWEEKVEGRITRRAFLGLLAAAGLAPLAERLRRTLPAGLSSASAGQLRETSPGGGDSAHRWAMVIDQGACIGCNYCTYACLAVNDVRPEVPWNEVHVQSELTGGKIYLPRPCMHCENPPCIAVCPVQATYRRPDGLVVMDYDRCIGCRYCMLACPYEARHFNWEAWSGENPFIPNFGLAEVPRRPRGVVEKCTFCLQRLERGLANGLVPGIDREATPACVVECPVEARFFGDLNDPQSKVSRLLAERPHFRLREDLGTSPRVYYLTALAAIPPTTPPQRRP